MKILIITDNDYTKYLAKAFHYENIDSEFINIKRKDILKSCILKFNVVLINVKKNEENIFKKIKSGTSQIDVLSCRMEKK